MLALHSGPVSNYLKLLVSTCAKPSPISPYAFILVLYPISSVEVIETVPPPELSLLLRLQEPREEEDEKKRMEIRGKYCARVRQFITASFSFPPSVVIAAPNSFFGASIFDVCT